jgi:hypothetical protein
MHKKAMELPINVIIVTIITLIVLVVLVAIFSGRIGLFGKKIGEVGTPCAEFKTTIDGTDYNAGWQTDQCGTGHNEIFASTDAEEHPGQHCCIVAK